MIMKKIIALILFVIMTAFSCSFAASLVYDGKVMVENSHPIEFSDNEEVVTLDGGYTAVELTPQMTGIWNIGYPEGAEATPYMIASKNENGELVPMQRAAFKAKNVGNSTIDVSHNYAAGEVDVDLAGNYDGGETTYYIVSFDPNVNVKDLKLEATFPIKNNGKFFPTNIEGESTIDVTAPGIKSETSNNNINNNNNNNNNESTGTPQMSGIDLTNTYSEIDSDNSYSKDEIREKEEEQDGLFKNLFKMIAGLIRLLANGLNNLVQFSVNAIRGGNSQIVTMDDLIFNHFDETSIDFYGDISSGSAIVNKMKGSVSKWYTRFMTFAVAGYLAVLLYIGVKILFSVGGKSAQYKELLLHWVFGIILLLSFKYVIRLVIVANNTLVAEVERSKPAGYEEVRPTVELQVPTRQDGANSELLAESLDQNIYANVSSNNYMAKMAQLADKNEASITHAVVYLIMVLQFIAMLIYYYKRIFLISFLIVIYPFVGLSFVLDKLGDGKSQAFDTWMKEFATNVFVQLIHAVAYVFVISATLSGLTYGDNWLIAIVGITFLFKGEQILKTIFQLGGSSARSLAETSRRTMATLLAGKAVGSAVSNTAKHTFSAIKTFNRYRLEKKTAQNDALFIKDSSSTSTEENINNTNAVAGISTHITRDNGIKESPLSSNPELTQAINTINELDSINDPQKLADALKVLRKNVDSLDPKIQEMIKMGNLSTAQIKKLSGLEEDISRIILRGNKDSQASVIELKKKVEKELDIEILHTLPAASAYERAMMKVAILKNVANTSEAMLEISKRSNRDPREAIRGINSSITNMGTSAALRRANSGMSDERGSYFSPTIINQEMDYKRRAIDSFFNPFKEKKKAKKDEEGRTESPFAITAKKVALSRFAKKDANRIMQTHFGATRVTSSKMQRRFASSVAIMHEFGAQTGRDKINTSPTKYTMQQVKSAADFLKQAESEDPALKRAIAAEFTYKDDEGNTTQLSGRDLSSIVNESIIRFHAKNPNGELRNKYGGFNEDVSIEVIRVARAVTEIEKSFYDPIISAQKGYVPFEITKYDTSLSSDATRSRDRMLGQYFSKTAKTATDDELKFCNELAIAKEYSASTKTLEERNDSGLLSEFKENEVTKYSLAQLQESFSDLQLSELDDTKRKIIEQELPVSATQANTYFSNEVKRVYSNSDEETKSRLINVFGLDASMPIAGERTNEGASEFEKKVALDAARQTFEEVIDEREKSKLSISEDGVSRDSITGITADDIFRLDGQIERSIDASFGEDRVESDKIAFAFAENVANARAKSVYGVASNLINDTIKDGKIDEDNINYLDKLANELIDSSDPTIPRYDGLTQEEHKEKASILKKKAAKELLNSTVKTTGVVLGGTIGAAMGIGIGDDSSMLHEALIGAAAGMTLGDNAALIATGKDSLATKKKTIKVISPYSGEIEEVEVKYQSVGSNIKILNGGQTVDVDAQIFNSILENEVLYIDDPRLRVINKFEIEDILLDKYQKAEKEKTKKRILKYRNAIAETKK